MYVRVRPVGIKCFAVCTLYSAYQSVYEGSGWVPHARIRSKAHEALEALISDSDCCGLAFWKDVVRAHHNILTRPGSRSH